MIQLPCYSSDNFPSNVANHRTEYKKELTNSSKFRIFIQRVQNNKMPHCTINIMVLELETVPTINYVNKKNITKYVHKYVFEF